MTIETETIQMTDPEMEAGHPDEGEEEPLGFFDRYNIL